MSDELERLIGRWGRGGEAPAHPPGPPTEQCLSYAQAEQIARGVLPAQGDLGKHIQSCSYCKRLLENFADAMVDRPVQLTPEPSHPPRARRLMLRVGRLALAASIVLALGLGLYFATQRPQESPQQQQALIASADIASPSGLTAKGANQFASGEKILIQIQLPEACYIALISLDATGELRLMQDPTNPSIEMGELFEKGHHELTRWVGYGDEGQETILVVASKEPFQDVTPSLVELQELYKVSRDTDAVAGHIRNWPAEVTIIGFQHVASD